MSRGLDRCFIERMSAQTCNREAVSAGPQQQRNQASRLGRKELELLVAVGVSGD